MGPKRRRFVRCATAARNTEGEGAEGREMVLGDVIGMEARALVGLDDLQALAVEPLVRTVAEVEVIEDAEFHGDPSHFPLLIEEWKSYRADLTALFSAAAASRPRPRSRASIRW